MLEHFSLKGFGGHVIEYCAEEVFRQGHYLNQPDGWTRTAWMLDAWVYAEERSAHKPSLHHLIGIGKRVERLQNLNGIRTVNVRVGPKVCPDHERVPGLLELLFEQRDQLEPLEFYRGLLEIHPFVDGNGRTGKIILNWLNGSLHVPIFPAHDFWGVNIKNP